MNRTAEMINAAVAAEEFSLLNVSKNLEKLVSLIGLTEQDVVLLKDYFRREWQSKLSLCHNPRDLKPVDVDGWNEEKWGSAVYWLDVRKDNRILNLWTRHVKETVTENKRQDYQEVDRDGYVLFQSAIHLKGCRCGKLYRCEGAPINWIHLSGVLQSAIEECSLEQSRFDLFSQSKENWSLRDDWNQVFPHNFSNMVHAGFAPNRYPNLMHRDEVAKIVVGVHRLAGWVRAIPEYRHLKLFIKKTQSYKGMNSPRTKVYLPQFVEKFPSPGGADKLLRKTMRRAKQIAKGFGVSPSWASVGQALMLNATPRKAALIALTKTLSDEIMAYKKSRDFLEKFHQFSLIENYDGVETRRDPESAPVYKRAGISVYPVFMKVKYNFRKSFLVIAADGRTYHDSPHNYFYECDEVWKYKHLIKEAVEAWKEQANLAKAEADLIGFLKGELTGAAPLFTVSDSINAGNCQSGTETFAWKMGWGQKLFVPGVWLIPHLNQWRVRNVAIKRFQREVKLPKVA